MATAISALTTWQGPIYSYKRQFLTSHWTPESNDRLQQNRCADCMCKRSLLSGLPSYFQNLKYTALFQNSTKLIPSVPGSQLRLQPMIQVVTDCNSLPCWKHYNAQYIAMVTDTGNGVCSIWSAYYNEQWITNCYKCIWPLNKWQCTYRPSNSFYIESSTQRKTSSE